MIAIMAFSSSVIGLLMINFPNGAISGVAEDTLRATGLNDLILLGLMFIVVGALNIGAFFSLVQSGTYQYRWSVIAGLILLFSMMVTIAVTTLYYQLQIAIAGVGIMIILLSLQLKGKWAA
jgi:hypothetical protein